MTKLQRKLRRLGACNEALVWLGERDEAAMWVECERADWLMWLLGKMCKQPGWPTHKEVVLLACAIVRTALPHVPKGEVRPLQAIETTERWTRGEATLEDVRKAADDAAYAADDAAAYAAYAVTAAYDAAAYAAAYTSEKIGHATLCKLIRDIVQPGRVESYVSATHAVKLAAEARRKWLRERATSQEVS